ncbi:response regulator transcription factor [Frankia sp. AgB1.8]|uniref:response regulator transcription factor n=1 Tax=Frankia sp. AgB1.8 TaxID=2792839 RepID=UPI00193464C2|nr:response regulator transcription factor [Frankia sp. AgB1.8]MBL7622152.1 response regulator transcription factor [Frankia sp. AgB1.8]
MAELLVVEDDETIGHALEASLRSHRHAVTLATTGADAVAAGERASFDLVLLDLGLPDRDGFEVCRDLRSRLPGTVIVILTARDEEIDGGGGLEAGADDYLVKPFRSAELAARIRAHLRRGDAPAAAVGQLVVGGLRVDGAARRAWLAEVEIALRAREFDLLARLASEPSRVLTRDVLMRDVWDEHWFGSTKTLDVHVSALRAKLAAAADQALAVAPEIVTVRGRGYRLGSA